MTIRTHEAFEQSQQRDARREPRRVRRAEVAGFVGFTHVFEDARRERSAADRSEGDVSDDRHRHDARQERSEGDRREQLVDHGGSGTQAGRHPDPRRSRHHGERSRPAGRPHGHSSSLPTRNSTSTATMGATPSINPSAIDAESSIPAGAQQTARADSAEAQDAMLMTPRAALRFIAASAAHQTEALRELRIRLDPEHLGPLVVRIRIERGTITATLIARQTAAMRALERDADLLRGALSRLGYRGAKVEIAHRPEEFDE